MRELCPRALLINYANPMAMICWYLDRLGSEDRRPLPLRPGHLPAAGARSSTCRTTRCGSWRAGINHQAWFSASGADSDDLYPRAAARSWSASHLPADGDAPRPRRASARDPGRLVYEGARGAGAHRADGGLRLLPHRVEPPRLRVRALLPQVRRDSSPSSSAERWDYYEICAAHDEGGPHRRAARRAQGAS